MLWMSRLKTNLIHSIIGKISSAAFYYLQPNPLSRFALPPRLLRQV